MISPEQLRSVLIEWPDAWRSATFWRMCVGERVTPEDVGYAYLQHLSSPASAEELFSTLLDEGLFVAADAALDHPLLRDAAMDVQQLEADLEKRRSAMQLRVLAEWDELARQALSVGVLLEERDARQFTAYCTAGLNGRAALESLRDVRNIIDEAIDARLAALRTRFDDVCMKSSGEPVDERWQDRVERAIVRRQVETVEALLESGPNVVSNGTFPVAPPMPIASFTRRYDPDEICRWSIDGKGGRPDFYYRFDPLRHGQHLRPFVSALLRLCSDRPATGDVASAIAEFEKVLVPGSALDAPRVVPFGAGFHTVLRGLGDAACEAFSAEGVDMYVEPKNEKLELPRNPTRPAILLPVDRTAEAVEGYVLLKPGDVLAYVGHGQDLAYNVLRGISSQLAPSRILDALPSVRWLRDRDAANVSFGVLRSFAARVLDLHGFDVPDLVIDRLTFYAFGRPALLHAILRGLFAELDDRGLPRTAQISDEHLTETLARPEYRNAARQQLLHPIEMVADARAVFAAMLIVFDIHASAADWTGVIPRDEVSDWLRSEQISVSDERFDAVWRLMAASRLIDIRGEGARFSRQHGGYMAMLLAGNRERYFQQAVSDAVQDAH